MSFWVLAVHGWDSKLCRNNEAWLFHLSFPTVAKLLLNLGRLGYPLEQIFRALVGYTGKGELPELIL